MKELIQALAEYDEAMEIAFDVELRARAGEMLAEKVREISLSVEIQGANK